ncbi:MAG: MBL fold metallo-hydrolase, partial [Bacteroidetes bacterium]
HMLGNAFVKDTYGAPFITHAKVRSELSDALAWGPMMGVRPAPSPDPDQLVEEGDVVSFGNTTLEVLFTPGHSEGHVSFFHRESGHLFSGDVLFAGSIGRTDLPGGDFPVLMRSIFTKLLPLGDAVVVHSGHGPDTSIGRERRSNPFLQAPA